MTNCIASPTGWVASTATGPTGLRSKARFTRKPSATATLASSSTSPCSFSTQFRNGYACAAQRVLPELGTDQLVDEYGWHVAGHLPKSLQRDLRVTRRRRDR